MFLTLNARLKFEIDIANHISLEYISTAATSTSFTKKFNYLSFHIRSKKKKKPNNLLMVVLFPLTRE